MSGTEAKVLPTFFNELPKDVPALSDKEKVSLNMMLLQLLLVKGTVSFFQSSSSSTTTSFPRSSAYPHQRIGQFVRGLFSMKKRKLSAMLDHCDDDGDDSGDNSEASSSSQVSERQGRRKPSFKALSIEVNSSLLHRSTENYWVGVKGPIVMHEKLSGTGSSAEKGSALYSKFLRISGLHSMSYLPEKLEKSTRSTAPWKRPSRGRK
jgi:hypothetical protein